MKATALLTIALFLMQAACSKDIEVTPLTSDAAQAAKIKAKSAQVHRVLVTLSAGQLPQDTSRSISSITEEKGDGDSLAMGSAF